MYRTSDGCLKCSSRYDNDHADYANYAKADGVYFIL